MKISTLRPQFYFPSQFNLTTQTAKTPPLLPFKLISYSKYPLKSFPPSTPTRITTYPRQSSRYPRKTSHSTQKLSKQEFLQVSSDGFSRFVILGTVSLGFAMFLVGMDDHKALALGPGGPLMEDFWDNMRRYGLYILTVSTGVIYTIFQPILELLKNPISAVLIITILGGSLYIVSQVVSAMVGISEFAYDYGY